ncbi:protein of unknown function [Thiomonas sp. Bio17B3]|nr:protein of unknown function [Thiomonas sp. Bio17B3]VDY08854.1 protein of unknown function [Thiomonas sp. Sup16B3]VDY12222.1 conserved protein of unknown function [Thiomonas sp. OC7]VDY18564.1 protein of unknown function [Thiomonas sp. CB2]
MATSIIAVTAKRPLVVSRMAALLNMNDGQLQRQGDRLGQACSRHYTVPEWKIPDETSGLILQIPIFFVNISDFSPAPKFRHGRQFFL